ncbi:MAG: glycosyltransferase family 2 protein [Oscillochloris sp.]|nr:glycosyltransferase family 2 protein [Oscillochloris sp.]
MADLPLVAIITLNWNRKQDTLDFLASCRGLHYPHTCLIVVDNGSEDGSPEAIGAAFPEVDQLLNGANLGFAAGMNVGLRHGLQSGAAFMLLANNDTTMEPDMLDQLVATAREQQAGLISPMIYYADLPQRIWWLGGRLRPLLLEIRRQDTPPHGKPVPFAVDFITGCGMLIARETLDRIGLLDERFFMYYEDSDYCLRARRAGVRVFVEPRAVMYHKVARSSGGSDSPNERYQMARSSVQYFRKHARLWQWPLIWPYRTGSAIRTTCRLLFRRRLDAARAYWRGLWEGARA